jgi:hypothetical protein
LPSRSSIHGTRLSGSLAVAGCTMLAGGDEAVRARAIFRFADADGG